MQQVRLAAPWSAVVVGYALAMATQHAVFLLFDIEAAVGEHLAIGLAFVALC